MLWPRARRLSKKNEYNKRQKKKERINYKRKTIVIAKFKTAKASKKAWVCTSKRSLSVSNSFFTDRALALQPIYHFSYDITWAENGRVG